MLLVRLHLRWLSLANGMAFGYRYSPSSPSASRRRSVRNYFSLRPLMIACGLFPLLFASGVAAHPPNLHRSAKDDLLSSVHSCPYSSSEEEWMACARVSM